MIELTPEQRQALDRQNGEAVRVVDPATKDTYILIREEVFSRRSEVVLPISQEPPADMDPQLFRCMRAYWRDLPELLKDKRNRGKWAAYRGDERVCVGKTQAEVYQECYRRGMEREEFYVGLIQEEPGDLPPWAVLEVDRSLYEFTELGEPPSEDG